MKDKDKAKEQLMSELKDAPRRAAVSEKSEVKYKQAEKIMSLPSEDYQKVLALLPIGAIILDMKGMILTCPH